MRDQEIGEQFQQESTQRAKRAHETLKALYQRNKAACQKDFAVPDEVRKKMLVLEGKARISLRKAIEEKLKE